jgi:4-alpha-glucanotransferase
MRESGVLMPIASLPGPYLIGDFGPQACQFVDLIRQAGFRIWQILPLNPLGYGNSPYQCYSSHALDECYVSPELLKRDGLIREARRFPRSRSIDYPAAKQLKRQILREAYGNFREDAAYRRFIRQEWVRRYAVFITFKEQNGLRCWNEWDEPFRSYPLHPAEETLAPYEDTIRFHMFVQFILDRQFRQLKRYANRQGVRLMGDLPFYVGLDSDDVYFHRECFQLYPDGRPQWIAGVPPDYFSKTGQRWGNPLYDWEHLRRTDYAFWFERLSFTAGLYDILRIDHFRAFDTYWKIDAAEPTAINGEWVENTGYDFFTKFFARYPRVRIVAEDLGEIRPQVYELRDAFHLMGMRVLEFDFFGASRRHEVGYIGTHDNDTLKNWYRDLQPSQKRRVRTFIRGRYPAMSTADGILQYALDLKCRLVILSITDLLLSRQRINLPGTIGSPNWEFRIPDYRRLKERLPLIKQMNEAGDRA